MKIVPHDKFIASKMGQRTKFSGSPQPKEVCFFHSLQSHNIDNVRLDCFLPQDNIFYTCSYDNVHTHYTMSYKGHLCSVPCNAYQKIYMVNKAEICKTTNSSYILEKCISHLLLILLPITTKSSKLKAMLLQSNQNHSTPVRQKKA